MVEPSISITQFNKIEIKDKLTIRHMMGIAIVQEVLPLEKEAVIVTFRNGPWHERTLMILRAQIVKIN